MRHAYKMVVVASNQAVSCVAQKLGASKIKHVVPNYTKKAHCIRNWQDDFILSKAPKNILEV